MIRAGKILSPFVITLTYIIFAALWIIYSDQFVLLFFEDIEDVTFFQTLKGLFYVLFSGVLIFWLVNRYQKKITIEAELSSQIADHSPLAIALLDKHANTTFINEQGAELIGVSREDIMGNRLVEMPYETFHLDGRVLKPEETFHYRVMKTGEIIQNERYMLRLSDGTEKYVSGSAAPIIDADGHIESVVLIVADKTEKIKADNKLKEQEERYRLLVNESPFAIGIYQYEKLVFVNPAACKLLEGKEEELIGKGIDECIAPSVRESVQSRNKKLIKGEPVHYPVEERYVTLTGKEVPVEVYATVFSYNNEPAIQVIATDISERLEREKVLRKTLNEKEIVISEMHHRVKNNMAIVSGLIQMQAFESDDDNVNGVLYDSVRRIQSIAMIHEELYQHQDLQNIRFSRHIEQMVQLIARDFENVEVDISFDMEDISINVNQAVPCALFVNEAITNVFRHAFGDNESGELKITFKRKKEVVKLTIEDNGKGFSQVNDSNEKTSFGVHLLQITSDQLHGALDIKNTDGTTIVLEFRLDEKKKGSAANL